jgi:hypothetical protein
MSITALKQGAFTDFLDFFMFISLPEEKSFLSTTQPLSRRKAP